MRLSQTQPHQNISNRVRIDSVATALTQFICTGPRPALFTAYGKQSVPNIHLDLLRAPLLIGGPIHETNSNTTHMGAEAGDVDYFTQRSVGYSHPFKCQRI